LTKGLRWDIQALGVRLSKAASAEESSRKNRQRAQSRAAHEAEIRLIVYDIKKLLTRIEDAVPLINLAIATSGASLSTSLPPTVSPSRLLQASTFLTAGDTQYSMSPGTSVQIGPGFTLTLYMLFAGYSHGMYEEGEHTRGPTWKEVIHKGRVKLMRVPLDPLNNEPNHDELLLPSVEGSSHQISGESKQNEYSYRLEIIEDLDDDRVHSVEEGEAAPGPYGDVQLAGIREFLPIHQISRIFYADTGKILNIHSEGESNSPVLLLKRDINAISPRRMMQEAEKSDHLDDYEDDQNEEGSEGSVEDNEGGEGQDDIDEQLRRESSLALPSSPALMPQQSTVVQPWSLPADLDPEWLALEVFVEEEEDSSSDDEPEPDTNDDSAYISHRPSSSGEGLNAAPTTLTSNFSHLSLNSSTSPATSTASNPNLAHKQASHLPPYPTIRSSLSLLEMLIRLTALQQFQQTSHLSIPDELLTFFLEESSTSGGAASEERKRMRQEARRKVGFDPYDESPIKRHGEEYQYGQADGQGWENYPQTQSRPGTPWDENDGGGNFPSSPGIRSRRAMTPQTQSQHWLHQSSSRRNSPLPVPIPSSPTSPYRAQSRRVKGPVERIQGAGRPVAGKGSPLKRGGGDDTDSTLGTSPTTSSGL
jgi:hypothetical protein